MTLALDQSLINDPYQEPACWWDYQEGQPLLADARLAAGLPVSGDGWRERRSRDEQHSPGEVCTLREPDPLPPRYRLAHQAGREGKAEVHGLSEVAFAK